MRWLISNTRSRQFVGKNEYTQGGATGVHAATVCGPLERTLAPQGHSPNAAAGLGS